MIRSMTGYGRFEVLDNDTVYSVEVKSVNHRFFEFSVRTPRGYAFLEDKLKNFFAQRVARGKIEVYVGVEGGTRNSGIIKVNSEFADSYVAALKEIKKRYGIKGKLTLKDVTSNNEVFVTERPKTNDDEVWQSVEKAAEGAVDAFIAMREVEGKRLADDVISRCNNILQMVADIETRSPETLNLYRERLEKKMREVLADTNIDEQRILTETAIFADKIAVDEETVRLKSHIAQLTELLSGDAAVGRKLDFVVQEMNREANTIGSKASDIEIARIVVDIKAEIEKIREQIQNIE
ncbi:MAG: YicC family protein [Clostridia bacterium]|nr:YicC family protein [Clostridia bacterium]